MAYIKIKMMSTKESTYVHMWVPSTRFLLVLVLHSANILCFQLESFHLGMHGKIVIIMASIFPTGNGKSG